MSKSTRERSARERVEQVRREQQAAERRRRLLIGGPIAVLVVAAIAIGVALSLSSSKGSAPVGQEQPVAMDTSRPPWSVPDNGGAYISAAGLTARTGMSEAYHLHAHLDVIVRGNEVSVPAGIGIAEDQQAMSALHTHDNSGIIHVENPEPINVTLGQLFTEWGVKLTDDQLGGLHAGQDKALRVYVNGERVTRNPTQVPIGDHDEIVVWYGKASTTPEVPASYNFPASL